MIDLEQARRYSNLLNEAVERGDASGERFYLRLYKEALNRVNEGR